MAQEKLLYNSSVLEELYTSYPVNYQDWSDPNTKHSASPTGDPKNRLFIPKRIRPSSSDYRTQPIADLVSRSEWPGFDFLNQQVYGQYQTWRNQMLKSEWYDYKKFLRMPISKEAMALVEFSLAYWSHILLFNDISLSMHLSDKFAGRDKSFSSGFVLLNGRSYSHLKTADVGKELREVVPALQGAFGIKESQIASNVDQPFPHRNVWGIPHGKMLVVPENYTDINASVLAIRLIPEVKKGVVVVTGGFVVGRVLDENSEGR